MDRHVRLGELLVGVEGLALLRNLYDGSDEEACQRLAEVREVLDAEEMAAGEPIREAQPAEGYRSWSESYDEPGNPIIELEQPAVWSLLDSVTPGRALDAGCGTGRHAAHLVAGGHEVLGVDLSPEMLERAVFNVPGATFIQGDVCAIPVEDQQFDLVVCGLALSHVADLRSGVTELARALRPGGVIVISVLHPVLTLLGWHAPFVDHDGGRAFVREHPHTHADYLNAFSVSGLDVQECLEPRLTPDHVRAKRRAFTRIPEAVTQAYVDLPGVLVWSATKPRAATTA